MAWCMIPLNITNGNNYVPQVKNTEQKKIIDMIITIFLFQRVQKAERDYGYFPYLRTSILGGIHESTTSHV